MTNPVSIALRARMERFEGEDRCSGQAGTADCGRVLRYVAIATYEPI